jgi:hypothetical protein
MANDREKVTCHSVFPVRAMFTLRGRLVDTGLRRGHRMASLLGGIVQESCLIRLRMYML